MPPKVAFVSYLEQTLESLETRNPRISEGVHKISFNLQLAETGPAAKLLPSRFIFAVR